MPATPTRLPLLCATAFLALLSTSCGRKDRVEVRQSRAPFADEGELKLGLSVGQRYATNEAQTLLRWTTPEAWNFLPATEFRHLNFDFGPAREGEAYLTLLPIQSGGGVLENFNRWRKQMGQEPLTEAGLAALPTKPVFGRPAPFLDVSGTFTGGSGPMMAPAAPKPGYRMLGIIFEAPGILFTLKMTGPEALVAANAAKFDAFAQSIGLAGTPALGL